MDESIIRTRQNISIHLHTVFKLQTPLHATRGRPAPPSRHHRARPPPRTRRLHHQAVHARGRLHPQAPPLRRTPLPPRTAPLFSPQARGIGAKRRFASAPIVKRQDAVTLKTVDGITIMVLGYLNKFQTLKNGFSHEVCDHFVIGFPYYWEEFADLSVREERADICGSKEVPCTDAYKTTSPGDHGTDTFDSTLSEASSGKKETLQPIHSKVSVDHNTTNTKKKREDSGNVECVIHSGPKETSQPIHSGPKETSQPIHSMVSGDRNTTHTKKKGKDGSNVERVRHSGPQTRSSARRITRSMQIR
ncbi:hypothetical protein ACS0TY_018694 [Phlomoides rotata]